eukprot:TRINITY_DN2390_c0_g2_i1.p1 TRINITY_DN2390_c0_g2~~TRINITY_DN2390_c0_g2_i1.p1  ORF type:complete len:315 (-),score=33.94 TRINITY_DN2390_c0_g2_i1:307-1182(-)
MVVIDLQLTDKLVPEIKSKLVEQRELSVEENHFCDDNCLKRYLRSRSNDVNKALIKLVGSLNWRKDFGVTALKPDTFEEDFQKGFIYVWNKTVDNRSVLVVRKRKDRIGPDEAPHYLQYLVFSLETAVKMLPPDVEKIVIILDMNGYSRENSPALSVTLETLRIFSGHYPERAYKVYIVDAPTIFSILYTAVYPFIDPVTKAKINFVYSEKYLAGEVQEEQDKKGFLKYFDVYKTPYNYEWYRELISKLWKEDSVQLQGQLNEITMEQNKDEQQKEEEEEEAEFYEIEDDK